MSTTLPRITTAEVLHSTGAGENSSLAGQERGDTGQVLVFHWGSSPESCVYRCESPHQATMFHSWCSLCSAVLGRLTEVL